jgi:asparagine synthase (glutamine-hydrolysing)
MCGICGIVDFSDQPDRDVVESMNARLIHRGPDMGGTCSFEGCVLGHRRLSILDLSDAAKQPMISEDGSTAIVFNGEIYNFQEIRDRLVSKGYTFRTRSDTEVLLELYRDRQDAMLDELNGMFAFAIWDVARRRLLLARDRLGKKPLYYSRGTGCLSFSSELGSLLEDWLVDRSLRDQALFEYFLYDFIPAPHTIFRDVYKLPAAHLAVFDAEGLHVKRYWRAPLPERANAGNSEEQELRELMHDAVRLRLIADVPLGSFLSGGIDSSLVTALMTRFASGNVKTFSISFPGTTHDESAWSRLAADFLHTNHSEFPVAYGLEGLFPEMVGHFGEPFGDSSAVPTWHLCKATRTQVTVALSGDGGDELFGGYDRYIARRVQVMYDMIPRRVRQHVIEPLVDRLPATTDYYGTSLSKKLKLFVSSCRRMRETPLAVVPRTFSREDVTTLLGSDYREDADPVLEAAREWVGLDPVSHMMAADRETYLGEDILTKVDRMSMAHALEVRSPLLDYRIVEFAARLPLQAKVRGFTTKSILREVAREYVPRAILRRSKYGFQVPLGEWFKGSLKGWAHQRLMDQRHDLVNRRVVADIWKEHQEGRADHAHKIWLLLVFNEWHAQMMQR